jgi:hypothetical protein
LYCDLLLNLGEVGHVKERAKVTLQFSELQNTPALMGLNYLSVARAWMLDPEPGETGTFEAEENLKQAVYLLRQGGQIDWLLYGLLTRATLHRRKSDINLALRDLSEVFRIAEGNGMGLHLADYHLESARLRVAQNDKDKAREHLTTAKEMIDRMGYHRRDKEVAELEAQLG